MIRLPNNLDILEKLESYPFLGSKNSFLTRLLKQNILQIPTKRNMQEEKFSKTIDLIFRNLFFNYFWTAPKSIRAVVWMGKCWHVRTQFRVNRIVKNRSHFIYLTGHRIFPVIQKLSSLRISISRDFSWNFIITRRTSLWIIYCSTNIYTVKEKRFFKDFLFWSIYVGKSSPMLNSRLPFIFRIGHC